MTTLRTSRRVPRGVWPPLIASGLILLVVGLGWRQARQVAGRTSPPQVVRLVEEAGRLRAGGDAAGARSALERALRLRRDDPRALVALGRLQFLDLSDPDSALASFRRAVAAAPRNPESHYGLGQLLHFHGQNDAARAAFRQALRLRPGWSHASAWLATTELEAVPSDVPAAIRLLEAAVAADPDYAYARYQLGRAYGRAGRWPEAANAFTAAVEVKPTYREAYYALGQALQRAGRRDEARLALSRFRELDVARREQRSRNVRRRAGSQSAMVR